MQSSNRKYKHVVYMQYLDKSILKAKYKIHDVMPPLLHTTISHIPQDIPYKLVYRRDYYYYIVVSMFFNLCYISFFCLFFFGLVKSTLLYSGYAHNNIWKYELHGILYGNGNEHRIIICWNLIFEKMSEESMHLFLHFLFEYVLLKYILLSCTCFCVLFFIIIFYMMVGGKGMHAYIVNKIHSLNMFFHVLWNSLKLVLPFFFLLKDKRRILSWTSTKFKFM